MQTKQKKQCPCKRIQCPRHGDCDACLIHHQGKRYQPSCIRLKCKVKNTDDKADQKPSDI